MTCPDGIVIQTEAQTTPYIRSKKPFTAMVILPDGRWYAELENGGTLQDLKASLLNKHGEQFPGGVVQLHTICGCAKHWSSLLDQMTVTAGAGLTVLAIPPVVSHILPAIPMKGESVAPTKETRYGCQTWQGGKAGERVKPRTDDRKPAEPALPPSLTPKGPPPKKPSPVEMVSSQRSQEEESMSSHPGTDMTLVEKWKQRGTPESVLPLFQWKAPTEVPTKGLLPELVLRSSPTRRRL